MTGWIQKLYNQLESRALHTNRFIHLILLWCICFRALLRCCSMLVNVRLLYGIFSFILVRVLSFLYTAQAHRFSVVVVFFPLFVNIRAKLWMGKKSQVPKGKTNWMKVNGLDRQSQFLLRLILDQKARFFLWLLASVHHPYFQWNRKFNRCTFLFCAKHGYVPVYIRVYR